MISICFYNKGEVGKTHKILPKIDPKIVIATSYDQIYDNYCLHGIDRGVCMDLNEDLRKLIKMTGERAKIDAKVNGTYVVYKNDKGQLIKEYASGFEEPLKIKDQDND